MSDVYEPEINPDDEPWERLQEGLTASEGADKIDDDPNDDDLEDDADPEVF
jgi:hypothetical protein